MPDDRLLHPRLRRSRKVGGLSFFEKWVWIVMIFECDDFGVLPDRAIKVAGSDDSLEHVEAKTPGSVRAAMDRVVDTGLFLRFEHQGQPYLCDPTWQDFQKVRWPRLTYNPPPTSEVFPKLSRDTSVLFKKFHSALTRPVHRLKANGLRLTAQGGSGGADAFDAFWAAYPRKVAKEAARKAWTKLAPDAALQAVILGALEVHKRWLDWTRDEGRFIPHPSTWLNGKRWTDDVAPAEPPRIADVWAGRPGGKVQL